MFASAVEARIASICALSPRDCFVAGDSKIMVVASLMMRERIRGPGKQLCVLYVNLMRAVKCKY
jgi:hypothetical protein